MICVDTKFFSHMVDCLKIQKMIHLKPLREKILWQDRIDKTVTQCEELLLDAVNEEKKAIRKKALQIPPDSSLFNEQTVSFEEI